MLSFAKKRSNPPTTMLTAFLILFGIGVVASLIFYGSLAVVILRSEFKKDKKQEKK